MFQKMHMIVQYTRYTNIYKHLTFVTVLDFVLINNFHFQMNMFNSPNIVFKRRGVVMILQPVCWNRS